MANHDWVEEWQMDLYILHWWSVCPDRPDRDSGRLEWWVGSHLPLDDSMALPDWEPIPLNWMVICGG
jgi:hypothetical protein